MESRACSVGFDVVLRRDSRRDRVAHDRSIRVARGTSQIDAPSLPIASRTAPLRRRAQITPVRSRSAGVNGAANQPLGARGWKWRPVRVTNAGSSTLESTRRPMLVRKSRVMHDARCDLNRVRALSVSPGRTQLCGGRANREQSWLGAHRSYSPRADRARSGNWDESGALA